MTILVIDDDERVRTSLRDILLFGGYQVIEAADGKSAMRHMEESAVDLVLTDLGMPGINGWELARWMKRKAPEIPVVLITGWGINLEKEKIIESGVDWIIGKPFQVNDVLETIYLFMKVKGG